MSLLTGLSPYLEEIKLGALIVAAGAIFAGGYHLGGLGPKADLQALQAADWQSKFIASQVALAAVQGQLAQAAKVTANNSTVIQGLTDANAKITADRNANMALAGRLLNLAKAVTPAGGPGMPKAGGGQPTPSASDAASFTQVESMVVDIGDECERTANQLNALIAQLKPQL